MPLDDNDVDAFVASERQRMAAANDAAGYGVQPAQAQAAIKAAPVAGVPAEVGMRGPQEVTNIADERTRQATLATSPHVQSFVASNPAAATATKNDWPSLVSIGQSAASFMGGPMRDFNASLGSLVQRQAALDRNPTKGIFGPVKDFIAQQQLFGETVGLGLGALQDSVLGPGAAAKSFGQRELVAQVGPKRASDILSFWNTAAMLALPVEAGGEVNLGRATEVPPEAPQPPEAGLRGPPGSVPPPTAAAPPPEFPSTLEPGPFETTPLQRPGVEPRSDALHAQTADVVADHISALQDEIAASPVHSNLPAVMDGFLGEHTELAGQTVHVDPAVIAGLYAQGHTPFSAFVPQITSALESGRDVELPMSTYLTETAGKPWAEEVNAATRFTAEGVSQEEAKNLNVADVASPQSRPVEVPGDLTEHAPAIQALAAKVDASVDQIFKEQFLTQLFTDPRALGMDKGQFERYGNALEEARAAVRERVLERTYAQIRRERTPEWKKQVEALQPHFARDLENHPDVRAARFLAEKGYKLDRDAVESFYPGSASRLPSNILAKNGTNPDDVADLLSYRSGAEMVSNLADLADGMRLAGAKNITEFIHKSAMDAAESQARSNLGYDVTPEGLLRAGREAATESPVESFLTKELQVLAKVANLPFSKTDLITEAGRQFNLLPVSGATNLKAFERGMWSNGNKIETKLLKEDPVQAFRLKQAQFLNYLQLRMAHKLIRRVRMDGRTWARVARKVSLTNTSQDAVNWTKDILATIGLPVKGNPEDLSYPINGYNSLGEFIAAKNGLGAQIINAPVVRASAPSKLPVGQYMGISDMIRSILKNGRAEKEVRVGEEKRDLEETVDRGVESLNRYTRTITKAEMEQPTALQAIDRARRYVDSWLVRLEQLMRDFGGRDFDSPFFQVVSRRLETAKGWNLDKRTELAKHFSDLNGSVGKGFDRWLKAKVNVPDLLTPEGDPVFNFHKDVVVAALHLGDEEALRKFAEGWKTDVPTVEAIVHAHMTDQAWKFVEGMWQAFDNLRPDIEAMYRRLTNVTPRMVEPRSFTIPAGGPATPRSLAGGYYPIIYDPARMPKEWVEQLDPQSMLGDHQYTRATPSNTYIKERTGLSAPIRMDLNQIHSRLNQVIHDLAYREALIDIHKFLTHPRLTSAISRKYGPEYVGKIRRNLERIARSESTDTNENHAVSKAVDWLTEGQMINMIGFSPTTLMKHGITALGQPFAEVGAARYAAAWGDMLRDLNGAAREASAESPEIRHIISMYGEDSYQQFLALTEKRGLFAQYKRFAFHTIGAVNKRIAIATYNAAKQMLLDRGHDELTAQAGANQIVRQALGSTGVTDAPDALSAGRSVPGRFYRLDNNFLTFFSHMYNKSREIPQSLGYAGEKVDLSRAFAVFLASIVLPVLVDAEVGRKVKQGGSWIGALALSLVHQVTRPVPGLNTTVAAGLHVATHGEEPTTDSPTASLGTMVGTSANDVHKALKDRAVTNSMIRHALILGGQILHGPGLEASRLEGWFNAMREGKEQDKPLPQQLEDFIYGPKETPPTGRGHSRPRGRRP